MAEPGSKPFTLDHRTAVILISTLPAAGLFALIMGIWHCVRKRNIAKRVERDGRQEEGTLRQEAFLADDERLPERSKSTAHQVPKLRIPNLPNLPKLKADTHSLNGGQVRSTPAAVVEYAAHQLYLESHSQDARTAGVVPVGQHSGRTVMQTRDHATDHLGLPH